MTTQKTEEAKTQKKSTKEHVRGDGYTVQLADCHQVYDATQGRWELRQNDGASVVDHSTDEFPTAEKRGDWPGKPQPKKATK